MAGAIIIPGPGSVGRVGLARDPGIRASPEDFGSGIGAAMADMGTIFGNIGEKLRIKRQGAEDDVAEQADSLATRLAAEQIWIEQEPNAGLDPENFHTTIGSLITKRNADIDKQAAAEGRRPSPEAQARIKAKRNEVLLDYSIKGMRAGHNARVLKLATDVEKNVSSVATSLAVHGDLEATGTAVDTMLATAGKVMSPAQVDILRTATDLQIGNSVVEYVNGLQDKAVGITDPAERNAAVEQVNGIIDQAVERGYIDAAKGAEDKRKWKQGYQLRVLETKTPKEILEALGGGAKVEGGTAIGKAAGLLKKFEGFRSGSYWDSNAPRVGYGSDTITSSDGSVRRVKKGDTVTAADAERDLIRRTAEFQSAIVKKVGTDAWGALNADQQAAFISITYNYGELPDRVVGALKSGDAGKMAVAVTRLGSDNGGINAKRRQQEAAIIAGGASVSGDDSTPSDPFFVDMPADDRQKVVGQARTDLNQEKVAIGVASQERRNEINLRMERGEIVSREEIQGEGLNPDDEAFLLNQEQIAAKAAMTEAETAEYNRLALAVEKGEIADADEIMRAPVDGGKKATLLKALAANRKEVKTTDKQLEFERLSLAAVENKLTEPEVMSAKLIDEGQKATLLKTIRGNIEKSTTDVKDKEYDRLAVAVETGTTTIDEIMQNAVIDEGQKATLIKRWQERNALGTYDTATTDFATIPDWKIDLVVENSRPEPGSPGYSVKRADYTRIEKAAQEVKNLRRDDPARAADETQPGEIATLKDAVNQKTEGAKLALATRRLSLQEYVGIDELRRQPLTNEEALLLADRITMHDNDPATQKIATTRLFQELGDDYGSLADEVAAQVLRSKGMGKTTSLYGASIMRKMGLGMMPTPEDAARMDRALEMDNIANAMNGEPVVKPKTAFPPAGMGKRGNFETKPKRTVPNAAQVELLRKNPALAPQFDERFGQDSAERFLKPRSDTISNRTLSDGSREIVYEDGWVELYGTDGSLSGYQVEQPK